MSNVNTKNIPIMYLFLYVVNCIHRTVLWIILNNNNFFCLSTSCTLQLFIKNSYIKLDNKLFQVYVQNKVNFFYFSELYQSLNKPNSSHDSTS